MFLLCQVSETTSDWFSPEMLWSMAHLSTCFLFVYMYVCAILTPEVYVGCLPLFLPTCVLCMCVLPACISACLVPLEV